MQIQKILVGTDFSAPAEFAITQAMHVARRTGAEIMLLHVGTITARTGAAEHHYGTYDREIRTWAEALFRKHRGELEKLREHLAGQGVVVSQALRDGAPPEALCRAAEELAADLVVVGSHGYTGLKRFLLGSVAEKVIRNCRATVLVARGSGATGGFRRILVPVVFDEWSDPAIETAIALAGDDAEIELFHCWRLPAGLVESWGVGQSSLIPEIREGMKSQVSDKLSALLLRHRQSRIKIVYEHAEAAAKAGIAQRLDMGRYDLAVVGSHGRRGAQRWFVGSVAEAIARHAPCSVAVVKMAREARER